MAIIRWKPFGELEGLLKDFPLSGFSNNDLAVDISEDTSNVFVEMQVPDIDPKNIDIEVQDSSLRVSGTREEKRETDDHRYYYREISRGSFERIVPLPCDVNAQETKAEYNKGMLKLTLPKAENVKPRKIHINVK